MTLPAPEPGLVVSYSYLWHREHETGREEGAKDRPCVIVLAIERSEDGATEVVVLPIKHVAPRNVADGMPLPPAVKQHLGLDAEQSWILLTKETGLSGPAMTCARSAGATGTTMASCRPASLTGCAQR